MKLFLTSIIAAIFGFSSVALSCVPTISMDVTYNIAIPGVHDLVAHESGGPEHAVVYIKMSASAKSVVKFDDQKLLLVNTKRSQGIKVLTFRAIGTGSHDIVVIENGRETVRQKVTTKMLPVTRGC